MYGPSAQSLFHFQDKTISGQGRTPSSARVIRTPDDNGGVSADLMTLKPIWVPIKRNFTMGAGEPSEVFSFS